MDKKEKPAVSNIGNIIAILTMCGGIITMWVTLNMRVAQSEVKIDELEKGRITNVQNIKDLKQELESNIKELRKENREDHALINEKLERLIRR